MRRRRDPIAGRYSRAYCGRGSRKRCQSLLRSSLRQAIGVSPASLYGQNPECRSTPEAACFDMNRSTVASGIAIPDFPFQNRPTFQQVVQLQRRLGR